MQMQEMEGFDVKEVSQGEQASQRVWRQRNRSRKLDYGGRSECVEQSNVQKAQGLKAMNTARLTMQQLII